MPAPLAPIPRPGDAPDPGGLRRPAATLADVAREAGVSIATASRALSGRGSVADATRGRVLDAVERLDFRPSVLGRSLRLRTTGIVGFVVPDVSSPFYANALKGAQHRLAAAGYQVALMDTDEHPGRELEAVRALVTQHVDGLILCSSGATADELRPLVERDETPIVFFDNVQHGFGDASATVANEAGVRLLVQHLAAVHGHARIAYVGGIPGETSGSERRAGFRLGMVAAGLAIDERYVLDGDWTHESGRRLTATLLALEPRPTAVVYADAMMALGGLAEARAAGFDVPGELALVSFDDSEAAALLDPPLTALTRRDREIGDLAASLLLRLLDGPGPTPADGEESGALHVRLPIALEVRRSCGCGAPLRISPAGERGVR
jgi:DNA-binding LacI/PurR family transcriptional regulator